MEAHAEVGKACFARLDPDDTSQVLFAAFGSFHVAKASGFKKSFQFSVLQKSVLARTKKHSSLVQTKVHKVMEPVLFAEISAENEATRAELKELDGVAKGSVAYLSFMVS